jgi:hypothetical protein
LIVLGNRGDSLKSFVCGLCLGEQLALSSITCCCPGGTVSAVANICSVASICAFASILSMLSIPTTNGNSVGDSTSENKNRKE